jgi:hypothetical protein
MKKVFFLLLLFCLFFSKNILAQTLTLQELSDFFAWSDTLKIDKVMEQKDWVYMSSEKEDGNQVDIWMKERQQGHVVQAMFVLVSNKLKKGNAHNQATLHLLSIQHFAELQDEASRQGFSLFKQEQVNENKQADYWKNDKFLLIFIHEKDSELPYKVMIAHLSKK